MSLRRISSQRILVSIIKAKELRDATEVLQSRIFKIQEATIENLQSLLTSTQEAASNIAHLMRRFGPEKVDGETLNVETETYKEVKTLTCSLTRDVRELFKTLIIDLIGDLDALKAKVNQALDIWNNLVIKSRNCRHVYRSRRLSPSRQPRKPVSGGDLRMRFEVEIGLGEMGRETKKSKKTKIFDWRLGKVRRVHERKSRR